MLRKENFVRNLGLLTALAPVSKAAPEWRVTNPFDSMYQLVYQLTMRTVGAKEIADNPELLIRTLSIFEQFENSSSNMRIVVPWLPTLKHLTRMYNGAKLYIVSDP
jgi:hypothetical protein